VVLLVIPIYALSQLSSAIDWRVLITALVLLSVFAYFSYRSDKQRAEAGEWRTPESTLHFIGLLGGCPGVFLAQRRFRHKTSKASFQTAFWTIVLAHQFLAVDSLLEWRFTTNAWRFIKTQTAGQGANANAARCHTREFETADFADNGSGFLSV
jgi:uncharacterized membrane protein YsdA (DUF1294 family)